MVCQFKRQTKDRIWFIRADTLKKHCISKDSQLTGSLIYGRIRPELNRKDDEGNQVFRNDFREPPVAARRYKVGKSLLPELVL